MSTENQTPDTDIEDDSAAALRAGWDERYTPMVTLDVIRAMNDFRLKKEDLESQLKAVNKEYDHLRLNLIPRRFDDEGIENLRVEGVGRVGLTADMYVSIVAGQQDAAYEWLRDIGKGSLIKETVASGTLKAAIKAMTINGDEINVKVIKATAFSRATITKVK